MAIPPMEDRQDHMENSRLPTRNEIEELVGFLPLLYAEGYQPVKQWHGGKPDAAGVIQMPFPEYDQGVEDFFRAAGRGCWCDYGYDPSEAGQMINDADFIKHSSLEEIKTMLTYCVRGERFGDGHWEAMIENGNIRRLLERLAELVSLM